MTLPDDMTRIRHTRAASHIQHMCLRWQKGGEPVHPDRFARDALSPFMPCLRMTAVKRDDIGGGWMHTVLYRARADLQSGVTVRGETGSVSCKKAPITQDQDLL